MQIELIYPPVEKRRLARPRIAHYCKWAFLFAGLMCAVVNLSTGGKAWSVVVIWSMWMVWAQLISPDIVEFNRISQSIKLIVNACILLVMIDWLLTPGWAAEVVPIIGYSTLIIVSILFFTDMETQRQNMLPLLLFCAACLVGSIVGLATLREHESWPFAVLCAIAFSLLVGCAVNLGKDFLLECRKRFCPN